MRGAWDVPSWLPAGRLIVPDPRLNEGHFSSEPALWVSDDPLPDAGSLLARLLMSRAEHGFWPLLLTGPYVPKRYLERLEQPVSQEWMQSRAGRPWRDPDCTAAEIASSAVGVAELTGRDEPPYLGLVPADDGAAAIAECGWLSRAGDTAETAAVIRSWQQRFGARLCLLGIDALAGSVAWPPQSAEQALLVAAEHLAFGKDLGTDFSSYASGLRTARVWRFWWD